MPIKDPEKRKAYYRIYMNKKREEKKTKAIELKGGKCTKCGYNKCIGAMQFHHRDPNKKEFNIGSSDMAWNKIEKELEKCDLLCSNCHYEFEYVLNHNLAL